MDQNDRRAIEGLFDKLSQVERQSPPRDAEAERFIAGAIGRQPGAPYFMAQTIVVQEQALTTAQGRIEALEAELAAQRSSSPFGRGPAPAQDRQAQDRRAQDRRAQGRAAPQGGGFLAGAAQTAMGVAGGMLLGNVLSGLFGGPAAASEPAQEPAPAEEDASFDDGGDWE